MNEAPSRQSSGTHQTPCRYCHEAPCICHILDVIATEVLHIEYPPPPPTDEEKRPYDW